MKAIIESDCQCQTENDETGEFGPSNECFGDCWDWQKDDIAWIIGEWQTKNNVDDSQPVKINGTNMNWNHVSGYAMATPKTILDKLTLNGDFSLEFEFDPEENVFNVIRRSHDEYGALFTFEPMLGCDKCGEPINAEIHAEELGMCLECSNAYFNHEDEE